MPSTKETYDRNPGKHWQLVNNTKCAHAAIREKVYVYSNMKICSFFFLHTNAHTAIPSIHQIKQCTNNNIRPNVGPPHVN